MGPWQPTIDEESGDTYYYNTVTGESTWTKPSDFPSHTAVWKKTFDPQYKQYYFFNSEDGTCSWTAPDSVEPASIRLVCPSSPAAGSLVNEQEVVSLVRAQDFNDRCMNWRRARDPTSNQIYYYHRRTGVVTWENPMTVLAQAAAGVGKSMPEVPPANLISLPTKVASYFCHLPSNTLLCPSHTGGYSFWGEKRNTHSTNQAAWSGFKAKFHLQVVTCGAV